MTKGDVIQCAGSPAAETAIGDTTMLSYSQEIAPLENFFSARGGESRLPESCEARVRLKDGRVMSVEYSPKSESKDARKECDDIFAGCHR
jgi:hypothetical protein